LVVYIIKPGKLLLKICFTAQRRHWACIPLCMQRIDSISCSVINANACF